MRGWWIFAGTAAVSLLSKYVIKWRGDHIFNPSNIGLVLCFLILGRGRAEPLDFWWGPMSAWLVLALAVILAGGFAILSRLSLLRVALVVLGRRSRPASACSRSRVTQMMARWHLGPITGFHFWWVLVTSPEVLVFLFFMITDPKTAPRGPRARGSSTPSRSGCSRALLIAPTADRVRDEGRAALRRSRSSAWRSRSLRSRARAASAGPRSRSPRRWRSPATRALLLLVEHRRRRSPHRAPSRERCPPITILPSRGRPDAADQPTRAADRARPRRQPVRPRRCRRPREALARARARTRTRRSPSRSSPAQTYRLHAGRRRLGARRRSAGRRSHRAAPTGPPSRGYRLTNVAPSVGLDFRQGSFRFGMSNDYRAMMGGGVCWLDYNDDGWVDLFAVNSYASADAADWEAHGGLPRDGAVRERRTARSRDVSASGARRSAGPGRRLRRRRPQRRRPHRPRGHDDNRHRPALEQRATGRSPKAQLRPG